MLNNVPVPGQSLGASRNLINANFATTDTAFSVDHVPYNDSSGGQGKHNRVSFPSQGSAPSFSSAEMGLFNIVNSTTTKNELYVHKITGAGTTNIPFTASTLSGNSAPASGASFWTYLPSGFIMIKGSSSGSGLVTINFASIGAPTLNQILGVFPVINSGGSTTDTDGAIAFVDTPTTSSFRVFVSARTTVGAANRSFSYVVWGY